MKPTTLSRGTADNLWIACGAIIAAAALTACAGSGVQESKESHAAPGSQDGTALALTEERGLAMPGQGTPAPAVPAVPPTPAETREAWGSGVALYREGKFELAVPRLEIAVEGKQDDPYAHYLLGLALWKSGNPQEAESALEQAGALDAGSMRTWINLARVRLDLNDPAGALTAADSALGLDTSSADALHQRGRALGTLGRTDEALDALRQAVEIAPSNGYLANTLGYQLLTAGRPEEALPFLETARGRLPKVAYVRNNLGTAYERTGRTEDAVVEFQAVVALGDTSGKGTASLTRLGREVPSLEPEQDVAIGMPASGTPPQSGNGAASTPPSSTTPTSGTGTAGSPGGALDRH